MLFCMQTISIDVLWDTYKLIICCMLFLILINTGNYPVSFASGNSWFGALQFRFCLYFGVVIAYSATNFRLRWFQNVALFCRPRYFLTQMFNVVRRRNDEFTVPSSRSNWPERFLHNFKPSSFEYYAPNSIFLWFINYCITKSQQYNFSFKKCQ